jgi:hypothetical protein
MHVTRLYAGTDGESHFEDTEIALTDLGEIGATSERIPATGLIVRTTGPDYPLTWHNAPRRQYVVMLSGGQVEFEVGDGSKRVLGAGDILLAEDTTGRGHLSRAMDGSTRVSLFIALD